MTVAGIAPAPKQPEKLKVEKDVKAPQPTSGKGEASKRKVAGIAPAPKQPEVLKAEPKPVRRRPAEHAAKKVTSLPDEFFNNLFYFSGMGVVVGSALSKGVYVPKRSAAHALDVQTIEQHEAEVEARVSRDVRAVKRARTEATELAEELRKLQALLSGLPTFGEERATAAPKQMLPPPPMQVLTPRKYEAPVIDMISKQVQSVVKTTPAPLLKMPNLPPPTAPKPKTFPPPPPPPQERVAVDPSLSDAGVFKGFQPGERSHPSWQDKYAGRAVRDAHAPRPFGSRAGSVASSGGEVSTGGLKSWELSRLRGLEARGVELKSEPTASGADFGGDYASHAVTSQPTDDDIASLAPFLVSKRSMKEDRAHLLASPRHMYHGMMTSPRSLASPRSMASPAPELPYCDL